MATTLLKKMAPKNLIGSVAEFAKNIEEDQMVKEAYRVYGTVNGIRTGESTYGPWVMFKGNHEAVNAEGEIFKAAEVTIMEPLQSMLLEALKKHDTVDYALVVKVKRRDDLERKYEYVISPIVEMQENDALAHLRALAAPEKQAALAAPDAAKQPIEIEADEAPAVESKPKGKK